MAQPSEVFGRKVGFCFGGPANTLRISVSAELGFLWVDTTINTVWVYDWNAFNHAFYVENPDGQPIVPDPDNGIIYGVTNESGYAVLLRPSLP